MYFVCSKIKSNKTMYDFKQSTYVRTVNETTKYIYYEYIFYYIFVMIKKLE